MPICALSEALTESEIAAARSYGAEATFFHAVAQGATEELTSNARFNTFLGTAATHGSALGSAIAKCRLTQDLTVFSGHGRGGWSRGALGGDPQRFVGLEYAYPGFISTSLQEEIALRFLGKREHPGSHPTLLELRLPAGYPALDIGLAGAAGEFELVIGRHARFDIINAAQFTVVGVSDPVVRLVLQPTA